MPHVPPGCAGCSLWPEKLYENRYFLKDDSNKRRPPFKWRKPDYWNPPTIYQRSYMPVVVSFTRFIYSVQAANKFG